MRACGVCAADGVKSMMKDDRRHLHEMEKGERFEFPGRKGTWFLESISRVRGWINHPFKADRPTTSFTTGDGEAVAFLAGPQTSRTPCAGGAEVIPL